MLDFEKEVCVLSSTSLHVIPVMRGFDQYTTHIGHNELYSFQ